MDQSLISAISVGCLSGFGTLALFFLYFKLAKVKRSEISYESKTIIDRKNLVLLLTYLVWQVVFPSFCLATGILTLEQMGFRLDTLPLGLLFTLLWFVFTGFSAKFIAKSISKAMKFNNKREIQRFWGINVAGALDAPTAAIHWSGTVLPLLIVLFSLVVPFPFAIVLAIVGRFGLHVLAHFMVEAGHEIFGSRGFLIQGLFLSDLLESVSFIISGSILAPMTFHFLGVIMPKILGVERQFAKAAGIPWEEPVASQKP